MVELKPYKARHFDISFKFLISFTWYNAYLTFYDFNIIFIQHIMFSDILSIYSSKLLILRILSFGPKLSDQLSIIYSFLFVLKCLWNPIELSFNFHLELGTFGYWIRTDYRTDGTIKLIFGGFIKSIKRGLKMSSRFLDWNFSKFFLLEKVVGKRKMSEGGICPRL